MSPTFFTGRLKSPLALFEESFPATDEFQYLSPDEKHRHQLETYHRDPKKAAAANRLAGKYKSPESDHIPQFIELNDNGGKTKRRRVLRYHILPNRSLRSWKPIIVVLGATAVIVFLVQILSAPVDPRVEWDKWPQATQPRRHKTIKTSRKLSHKLKNGYPTTKLGDHKITNGILKVNPDSVDHPIRLLINSAKREWKEKVSKQSHTLGEAVEEYKRRYNRVPPKGFDKWWSYVVEHNIPLPDEYDQIQKDLTPFYSVSPTALRRRSQEASASPRTFTLKIIDGQVTSEHAYDSTQVEAGEVRPQHQIALVQPIAHHLPDMSIVMSISDTPSNLLSWQLRSELLRRDRDDPYIDDDVDPNAVNGYPWACPISSPLFNSDRHSRPVHKDGLSDVGGKTFISDLREYMNICNHPELMEQHGLLIGKNPPMESPSPIISLSKTALHADILGVPTEQWVEGGPVPAWNERVHDKVLWRGSNTGMHYDENVSWRNSQRMRLINMTNHVGAGDVFTLSSGTSAGPLRESVEKKSWSSVNAESMDTSFTGRPLQCDRRDGTCEKIAQMYPFSTTRMNHQDALQYKYIVDVDGNAWSARFNRLFNSGSLIMKATIMPEWYSDRIQPWVHFVPLKMDFSDLYDVVAFFRPSDSNPHAEEELAAEIAAAGRGWASTHWRREDMTAYVFRLYLEWARLIAMDRRSMDFVYSEGMEI